MPNAIADEVNRSPMSPNLVATLARAAEDANTRQQNVVTLEHLLLALIDDPDAGLILNASNIDLAKLRASVEVHLGRETSGEPGELAVSADLSRILAAAAAAAQQGRRSEISGAIVLAAIVGDGKSEAAQLLRVRGLTFDAAIRALQRAAAAPPPAPEVPAPPPPSEPPLAGPAADSILAAARERVLTRSAPATENDVPPSPDHGAVPAALEPRPPEPPPAAAPSAMARSARPEAASRADRIEPRLPEASVAPAPPAQTGGAPTGWPHEARGGRLAVLVVESAPLAIAVSRAAKVLKPATIEARVPKAKVKAVLDDPRGRREVDTTKAMSVRLRSPDGDAWVETASPETVWIESTGGLVPDDFAGWRWTVIPKARGRRRLQIVVSARAIGEGGLVTQTALPDQTVELRVRGDFGRFLGTLALWIVAACLGGLLAYFGRPILDAAWPVIDSVLNR